MTSTLVPGAPRTVRESFWPPCERGRRDGLAARRADGKEAEAPSLLIKKAILNGVQNGRAGKGSIYVFASGNGGAVDDQCNFDGYTNSIYSITVGAIDRKGQHPYYSEACSAVMVVTYSSGGGDQIVRAALLS